MLKLATLLYNQCCYYEGFEPGSYGLGVKNVTTQANGAITLNPISFMPSIHHLMRDDFHVYIANCLQSGLQSLNIGRRNGY